MIGINEKKKKASTTGMMQCTAIDFQIHNLILYPKPLKLFPHISINCYFPLKECTHKTRLGDDLASTVGNGFAPTGAV